MVGALNAVLPGAGARVVAAQSYDGLVDSFAPVSHWPLRETSGPFADRKDVSPAHAIGTPKSVGQALVQQEGGASCIAGDGLTTGLRVTASGAYGEPSGGVAVTVQLDTIAVKQQLVNQPSGLAGAFALEVLPGGQLKGYRFDGAGVLREVVGSPGDVIAGDAYHLALTWGPAGLKLYSNGGLVDSNPTTNWTSIANTDLYFFQWESGIDRGDGLIAHVIFFASQPNDAAVASLAQAKSIAVAVDVVAGTVVRNNAITINLRTAEANYKEPIVPVVESQPSLGTAAPNGQDIDYLAGATTGVGDTFAYHFVSANGALSETRTVTIDVVEAGTSFAGPNSWPSARSGDTLGGEDGVAFQTRAPA